MMRTTRVIAAPLRANVGAQSPQARRAGAAPRMAESSGQISAAYVAGVAAGRAAEREALLAPMLAGVVQDTKATMLAKKVLGARAKLCAPAEWPPEPNDKTPSAEDTAAAEIVAAYRSNKRSA